MLKERMVKCRSFQGSWIFAEQLHVNARRHIAADGAGKNQDKTSWTTPSAQYFHGLIYVLLMDNINDVCPLQVAVCSHAGKGDHNNKKGCG